MKHSKIPKHRIVSFVFEVDNNWRKMAGKYSRVKMLQKLCFITGVDKEKKIREHWLRKRRTELKFNHYFCTIPNRNFYSDT